MGRLYKGLPEPAKSMLEEFDSEDYQGVLEKCADWCDRYSLHGQQQTLPSPVNTLCIHVSPVKAIAIASCENKTLHVIDLKTNSLGPTLSLPATADSIVLMDSTDGEITFAAGCSDGRVRILRLKDTGDFQISDNSEPCPRGIRALSSYENRLYIGAEDGNVYILGQDLDVVPICHRESGIRSMVVGRLGDQLSIIVGTYRGRVEVLTPEGRVLGTAKLRLHPILPAREDPFNNWVRALTLTRLGEQNVILAGSENNYVTAHRLGKNQRQLKLLWHYKTNGWIFSIAAGDLNNDGKLEIAVGTWDGMLHILSEEGDLLWLRQMPDKVFSVRTWQTEDSPPQVILGLNNGEVRNFALDSQHVKQMSVAMQQLQAAIKKKIGAWGIEALQLRGIRETEFVVNSLTQMQRARVIPVNMHNYTSLLWKTLHFLLRLSGSQAVEVANFKTHNWITATLDMAVDDDSQVEVIAGTADGQVYVIRMDGSQLGDSISLGHEIVNIVPNVHDGDVTVIVATRNGEVFRLKCDPTGLNFDSELISFQEEGISAVAGLDNRLIVASGTERRLYILEKKGTHHEMDLLAIPNKLLVINREAHQWVVVGHENGLVAHYEVARWPWRATWTFDTHCQVTAIAYSEETGILIGTDGGDLYAFEPENGILKWSFATRIAVSAISVGKTINQDNLSNATTSIYVGSWDSQIYCLGPSGDLAWVEQMDDWVVTLMWLGEQKALGEHLVIGSADRKIHVLRLRLDSESLLDKCWSLLKEYGYRYNDLLNVSFTALKSGSNSDFLLRCFAFQQELTPEEFQRYRDKFLTLLDSDLRGSQLASIRVLPSINSLLKDRDRESILAKLLTSPEPNTIVRFLFMLPKLPGWDSLPSLAPAIRQLLKHQDAHVRYAAIRFIKNSKSQVRAELEDDAWELVLRPGEGESGRKTWLRVAAALCMANERRRETDIDALKYWALGSARLWKENQMIRDLVTDKIAQTQLLQCVDFSERVVNTARRGLRQMSSNPRLEVVICGSVARRTAIENVSDADFFVLFDDEGIPDESRAALVKAAQSLLDEVAEWFKSDGRLLIDVDSAKEATGLLTRTKYGELLGKFPTLFSIDSIVDVYAQSEEPRESGTRRLSVLAESDWLLNPSLLTKARQKVDTKLGISKKIATGNLPKMFFSDLDVWLQGVEVRTDMASAEKAKRDEVKFQAYRKLCVYSIKAAVFAELSREFPDSVHLLSQLQSPWITRMVALVGGFQADYEIRDHVALLLKRLGTLLKTIPYVPPTEFRDAMTNAVTIGTTLEELCKKVEGHYFDRIRPK